jgi:DNA (cytosine-5)-methyltransferase 1
MPRGTLHVLDLFAGIGGFSLGLERAGMSIAALCESDPFRRRVLARRWPHARRYDDVRTLTADRLRDDGIAVDVVCGGFPCQDISAAGAGAGITGKRSRLWFEFERLVRELRPGYVLVENTAALLDRGLDIVLGGLAALGFDAEWHCIPACAVGADHIRDRTWVIAYRPHRTDGISARSRNAPDVAVARLSLGQGLRSARQRAQSPASPFAAGAFEPSLVRSLHGIPDRVDRVKSLGDAIVPQVAEVIGAAIMAVN